MEKNQDTPIDELEAEDAGPSVTAEALGEGQVAQSIVCNDCGKKFRTKQLAGFHAEKTYVVFPARRLLVTHDCCSCLAAIVSCTDFFTISGHDDFAESTEELPPLTEEEKAQRLQDMRAALAEKRAKQAVIDKEEQKRNEVSLVSSSSTFHRHHHHHIYLSQDYEYEYP